MRQESRPDQGSRVKKWRHTVDREKLPPQAPSNAAIKILERGDFIHYPASEKDIREILKALPAGNLNGISSVEMSVGIE